MLTKKKKKNKNIESDLLQIFKLSYLLHFKNCFRVKIIDQKELVILITHRRDN